MPAYRAGRVAAILEERRGLQRVTVDLGGAAAERAYVLTELVGDVAVGDDVVVNTTAVDLGLGTGGWHVVHWNLGRRSWHGPSRGHVLKLRYTSVQTDTGVAEEADDYVEPAGLGGRPVLACFLHSQLAIAAAAFAATAPPGARLVYVMTDGGALPLALSDVVHALCRAGLLHGTVTAGHAFGGDHEAVTLASALDVAVTVAGADAVVVAPGPGTVGTGTERGTTSADVAWTLDLAARRGGLGILAVRCSDADPRPRHRGLSHHVQTVLGLVHEPVCVAYAAEDEEVLLPGLAERAGHRIESVPDAGALLEAAGISVTSMGRTAADDPAFFRWAAAAGAAAAALLP